MEKVTCMLCGERCEYVTEERVNCCICRSEPLEQMCNICRSEINQDIKEISERKKIKNGSESEEISPTLVFGRRGYNAVKCYYHPDRDAEAKCRSCERYICVQDIRRKKDISCVYLCGSFWLSKEERIYCIDCYNLKNQSSKRKLNGTVLKDR